VPHLQLTAATLAWDCSLEAWITWQRLRYLKKPWYEHTHIFFPIHKGVHWISATLRLQQKVLVCYDPLGVSVVNTMLLCSAYILHHSQAELTT